MKRRILVVHQSAELYGSDRSLLDLIVGADKEKTEFVVCLPEDGPLRQELTQAQIETHVTPVVKISRKQLTVRGLAWLPWEIRSALRGLTQAVAGRPVDIVYSNTVAVIAGALWAKVHGKPHVWHIREIVHKPTLVSKVFQLMVKYLSTKVVCNSHETACWISGGRLDEGFHYVIWNGVDEPESCSATLNVQNPRCNTAHENAVPNILLVGRINAWKGQDLLLDALDILLAAGNTRFSVTFVGGPPPGQPEWLTRLQQRIDGSPLREHSQIVEFTKDITDYYAKADIVVVPSREPEPFGRVAIEAMAAGLPVVAAAHGGLLEIVEHQITGKLVAPNDANALAEALCELLQAGELRQRMGSAGRQRQRELFSLTAYLRGVTAVFDSVAARP